MVKPIISSLADVVKSIEQPANLHVKLQANAVTLSTVLPLAIAPIYYIQTNPCWSIAIHRG
jgi:hypothetical protein